MKIKEIQDILKAEVLVCHHLLDNQVIGGGAADLMDDILAALAEGSVLLTGIPTEQVVQTAKVAGVGAIVLVRGKRPVEKVVKLAQAYDLPLLTTNYSLFVSCGRLYMNGLRGLDGSW